MWTVTAADVMSLQGQGERFTAFVDALCRAHAFTHGLPLDRVRTNERVNQKDGGVDTRIADAVAGDTTGWFGSPTLWQHKAQAHVDVKPHDLREEASKPRARALAAEGHAYRLAVCDSLPERKATAWVDELSEAIKSHAPDAPPARVLTADDLASWASRHPGIVARFFRPNLDDALSLEVWGRNITSVTRSYVRVPSWESVELRIGDHATMSSAVRDPVLPILGDAGVGKTRLVYEVLLKLGAAGSVVYTSDEQQALRLARLAANRDGVQTIIVADECSLQARLDLNETLRGVKSRVRVVAIHNEDEEVRGGAPRVRLERIPQATVTSILKTNFPDVPDERLRTYVDFTGGFVRFAADLCDNDATLLAAGIIDLDSVRAYYSRRLHDPTDRDAVGVVAVVQRVGYRDDLKEELVGLCKAIGAIEAHEVVSRAPRLKDSPGFLAIGGRFLYVTPKIVAKTAFEDAWDRWLSHDLKGFVERLPAGLLQSFQDRVASSASKEVREVVSRYFRAWAEGLTSQSLTDLAIVERLEALAETSPVVFLPIIERLVLSSTTLDQVLGVGPMGGWGPRRKLVWLMERLIAFPEHFHAAETVLFKLALHETEDRIGNNATEIWRQVHRPYLSGTATPFAERLKVLERRIFSEREEERAVAVRALDRIFESHGITRMGRSVVAGRIPPEDWAPQTRAEAEECTTLPLDLLGRMRSNPIVDLQAKALEVLRDHANGFLYDGQLARMRRLLELTEIDAETRASLVASIRGFLQEDVTRAIDRNGLDPTYGTQVQAWLETLLPRDLHGRLVQALAIPPWDAPDREGWTTEVDALAAELLAEPAALVRELDWLMSDGAASAGHLGHALGRRDVAGALLPTLVDATGGRPVRVLQRGYVLGLLESHPERAPDVTGVIDALEAHAPTSSLELALCAPGLTGALVRALRLVDAGHVDATVLGAFALGGKTGPLAPEDMRAILERLTSSTPDEDARAARLHTGLDLVSMRLHRREKEGLPSLLADPETREVVWRLLMQPAELLRPNDSYHWQKLLKAMTPFEPERAARAAADALGGRLRDSRAALEVLVELHKNHPELVVREVGRAILDPESGYRPLSGEEGRAFVASLDATHVVRWLDQAGVEGARRLASALPLPHLDSAGKPVVPLVTELVLERFGADERTLREFCLGSHSLQIYSGDIAAQHEAEAAVGRAFLTHPLKAIRDWAAYEVESGLAHARRERRDDDEERALE